MPTQTKENYLKAIYALSKGGNEVSVTELSKEMKVSAPTVNNMVKKLEAAGWVTYRKYKPLKLTNKGRTAAAMVIRKHRLSEMFLVKIMGFGWEEVHDIAEEMEHIHSEKLFDRMDELLGYPTIDPHGSPIPDKSGVITRKDYIRLSEVKEGQTARFCSLENSSAELLRFLNVKHIKLGTEITILKIEAFDKSCLVAYDQYSSVMLSHEVCKCLMVEVIK